MLKKVVCSLFLVEIICMSQNRPIHGFTRLQASTNFACIGENVTFSCTTSNSFLIWEVMFAGRTIQSVRRLFETDNTPGRVNFVSTHGVHLYFVLVSKMNGILDSILVARTSALLENAVVECRGADAEVQSRTFRFAYAPSTPTGVLISDKMYNSSEFGSATLNWNDPAELIESYNIKISVGSNNSQQFGVAVPSLNLNQIPYNENVTVSISAVNCVAESEEVNVSFVISVCSLPIPLLRGGLATIYNTSSNFNRIVPSGEQLWFGCEQGFYAGELEHIMVSTCQENGLWYPDLSEAVCQNAATVTTSESALTFANNTSIGNSCSYCFIYIITGSVVGIFMLLVVCTLLFALMICIIIRSNNNRGASSRDYDAPNSPVYECIPNSVGRCLNPTVASVMTENEAYKLNTCSGEISAYDIVKT